MIIKSIMVIEAEAGARVNNFLDSVIALFKNNVIDACVIKFNGWEYEYDSKESTADTIYESWYEYFTRGR